jgi:hypothetical protein
MTPIDRKRLLLTVVLVVVGLAFTWWMTTTGVDSSLNRGPEGPSNSDQTQPHERDSVVGWTVPNVWGPGLSGLPVVPLSVGANGSLRVEDRVSDPSPPAPPGSTINSTEWIRINRFDPIPSNTSFARNPPTLRYLNFSNVTGPHPGSRTTYPAAGLEGKVVQASNLTEPGDHAWSWISSDPQGPPTDENNPVPVIVLRLGVGNLTRMHEPFVANGSMIAFIGLSPFSGAELAVGPDWPFKDPGIKNKTRSDVGPHPVSGPQGFALWDPRFIVQDSIPVSQD